MEKPLRRRPLKSHGRKIKITSRTRMRQKLSQLFHWWLCWAVFLTLGYAFTWLVLAALWIFMWVIFYWNILENDYWFVSNLFQTDRPLVLPGLWTHLRIRCDCLRIFRLQIQKKRLVSKQKLRLWIYLSHSIFSSILLQPNRFADYKTKERITSAWCHNGNRLRTEFIDRDID